jgi:hypothetical protein
MAVLQDWLPPSKANWSLIVRLFTWFPTVSARTQHLVLLSIRLGALIQADYMRIL